MFENSIFQNFLFSPLLSVGMLEELSFIVHVFNCLFTYYISVCIHGFLFYSLCSNLFCFLILSAEIVPDTYNKSSFKLAPLSF